MYTHTQQKTTRMDTNTAQNAYFLIWARTRTHCCTQIVFAHSVNVEHDVKRLSRQRKREKSVCECAHVSVLYFKTHVCLVRWWTDVKCIPPLSKTTFSPHKLFLPPFWPPCYSFINHSWGHLSFCSIFHSPWQDWPLFPYWIFPSQIGPVGQQWGIGQALNSQSGG